MYRLRIHKTLLSVKSSWKRLEENSGAEASAYQSYYVNAVVKKRLPVYGLKERYGARYLELLEDGKPVLILPVCKYRGRNEYCSIGKFNGFQVYDCIYSREMTIEKMQQCMEFILKTLHLDRLVLYNVPEYSVLYQAVNSRKVFCDGYSISTGSNDNVTIDTENDYDLWHSKLSKSTRQNIRTAYNRMNTDGVQLRVEILRGERIKRKTLDHLIDLYCKRHEERYDVATSAGKMLYLKYLDFSTACLRSYRDNFCAMVYMNGQLAAFMSGLVEKQGRSVVIPRLSIEDQFSRYSPGVVLINETVKWLASDTGIRFLDLSKGAEGYKLSMGGQMYDTHSIEFAKVQAKSI